MTSLYFQNNINYYQLNQLTLLIGVNLSKNFVVETKKT